MALTDKLTNIANAIRAKTETTEPMTLDEMPTKIANIETKSEPNLQDKTIEITENGTQTIIADEGYDGLNNVSVTTNIASSGGGDTSAEDGFVTRTLTSYSNDRVTYVGQSAFNGFSTLTSVSLSSVKNVHQYAFSGCSSLNNINLPLVEYIDTYSFSGCSALETIKFPFLTDTYIGAFNGCTNLTKADLGKLEKLTQNLFQNCTNLETLILRRSNKICSWNASALKTTKIVGGTGYIYVPSSLVGTYKTASGYSTYANQIRAIEDYPDICG